MIDIASLISLCNVAIAGGSKVIEKYKNKKYSDEEIALLKTGAQKGEYRLMSIAQSAGTWVRVNGHDFVDDDDPAVAATHLEAFRSLCERGYIVHEGGHLFMLTGLGFKKARKLAG
jgi:hypothetical protein